MNLTQTITFHEIKPGDELPTSNCHLALTDGGMTWGAWDGKKWQTASGNLARKLISHCAPPLKHPAQVEDAK